MVSGEKPSVAASQGDKEWSEFQEEVSLGRSEYIKYNVPLEVSLSRSHETSPSKNYRSSKPVNNFTDIDNCNLTAEQLSQSDTGNEIIASPIFKNKLDKSRSSMSEPPLVHGSGNQCKNPFPVVNSYNDVKNEYSVRGSKEYSLCLNHQQNWSSQMKETFSSGHLQDDEVKQPEGVRQRRNRRRVSIFSSCAAEDSRRERVNCNRETLLAIIANLQKEVKVERELRQMTQRMLSDSQLIKECDAFSRIGVNNSPQTLEEQSVDSNMVVKASDSYRHIDEDVNNINAQNNHLKARSPCVSSCGYPDQAITADNSNSWDLRAAPGGTSNVADFRSNTNPVRPWSEDKSLNVKFALSTDKVNKMRNVVLGNVCDNSLKMVNSQKKDMLIAKTFIPKAKVQDDDRSTRSAPDVPPLSKEFFYLTAISVKVNLGKKFGVEPSVGTSMNVLWSQAKLLNLPFTEYYDFIMANDLGVFKHLSERS